MGSPVAQNGYKCVSAISSGCKGTKLCYILAFSIPANGPTGPGGYLELAYFSTFHQKREHFWRGGRRNPRSSASSPPLMIGCPALPPWHTAAADLLFVCPHLLFYLARRGNFFEIRPLSLQWVTQSFNAVISQLYHWLQIQFQGSWKRSLSTLCCVAFVSVPSKAITLGS